MICVIDIFVSHYLLFYVAEAYCAFETEVQIKNHQKYIIVWLAYKEHCTNILKFSHRVWL